VKMDAMDMGPQGTYQMFGRAGEMLGAMYNKPPEMTGPPNWLCYALVPNADSAATVVQRLGGKVMNGPMDIPGGRIAQCMDPQGAAFALHSNAPQAEAASKPKRSAKKAAKKAVKEAAETPATKAGKEAKKAKKAAKRAKKAAKKERKAAKKATKKAAKEARKAAKKVRKAERRAASRG
jgi:predicted enzyme related to lactoylglutathione lyase